MTVFQKKLILHSNGRRVTYHNIREDVKQAVRESGVKNGIVTVQSPHTTCSVIFEEFVHDKDFNGDEYLQVDLNRILDRIVPRELSDGTDYRYPGPKHVDFLMSMNDPNYPADPGTILNGDAHIRGSLFGASQTFVITDGVVQTGTVGSVYFVDWDQNRERDRKCLICVIGE